MCRMQPSVWEALIDKLCWTEKALNEESIPLDGTLDSQRLGIEESILFGIDSQPYFTQNTRALNGVDKQKSLIFHDLDNFFFKFPDF